MNKELCISCPKQAYDQCLESIEDLGQELCDYEALEREGHANYWFIKEEK